VIDVARTEHDCGNSCTVEPAGVRDTAPSSENGILARRELDCFGEMLDWIRVGVEVSGSELDRIGSGAPLDLRWILRQPVVELRGCCDVAVDLSNNPFLFFSGEICAGKPCRSPVLH